MAKKTISTIPVLESIQIANLEFNDNNQRFRHEYFPGGEEQAKLMGHGLLANGVDRIPALEISRRTNGVNLMQGGHRRYLALKSVLPESEFLALSVPCLVYKGLTEDEELLLMFNSNGGRIDPGPFSQSLPVRRLAQRKWSNKRIAEHIGKTPAYVGRLLLLTEIPVWAQEMASDGLVMADTIWALYDSIESGTVDEKRTKLNELLEAKKAELEESGRKIKFADFGIPSREEREQAKARLVEAQKLETAIKQFNDCASAVETCIKSLPDALKPTFQDRVKAIVSPTDSTNKAFEGKSAVERYDTQKAEYQTILADIRTSKEQHDKAEQDKAELAKTHAAQDKGAEALKQSADASVKTDAAAKTDAGDKTDAAAKTDAGDKTDAAAKTDAGDKTDAAAKTDDSAAKQGQGETEASRRKARIQALVGMINSASDTTSLTKDAKSRLGDAVKRLNDIQKWSLELVGLTE